MSTSMKSGFDEHASEYDAWFMKNTNVLYSEVKLVAHFLKNSKDVFSVGCGSGLFEMILEKDFGISIKNGLEPSAGMANIACKRGMTVDINPVEQADLGIDKYDTVLFNGTPSYITDLQAAFNKAFAALRPGGKVVVIDVPKESSYALLYNLAKAVGTWEHPLLEGVHPEDPYPIEFVKIANWRTTAEKVEMLKNSGFHNLEFAQTLTRHPIYSNNTAEEPTEGYDRGDYVAICARK
ncbi:Ubiquinone/menaquinone biosynthesis C-methylase UbiE [Mariniphaga anaerophila]|uniref:Ubiquinone/menaquinone biosynthesis C-methylase UbiE n=1 Tax=Mariniphaga anaerophila TaxID=1484053 RepID=A0A1M4VUI8_9BACT|nr:class I SAM-dependent methyltransferase [Mariniphaga anaerophila]SHE72578.1 Ubiquinone/menaquinone biosynthesis C-methylase UbiE [Mariniphaga anaerophila]